MDIIDRLSLLPLLDTIALCVIVAAWISIGLLIEHPSKRRPSVIVLMADYRRDWMREFITRDPRVFDAQMLASLRQGTSFFASTCILAIGGVLALAGNTDGLIDVANELSLNIVPHLILKIKLILVALFLTNAFLKFVWANRLYGYCGVVMASVPNEPTHPHATHRAAQAAEMNIRADWNFNRGLRSVYFALGALPWLLGAVPMLLSTALTVWVLWSREFASRPRKILLDTPEG